LNGKWYRNENGQTWVMTKRGKDTWASDKNWNR